MSGVGSQPFEHSRQRQQNSFRPSKSSVVLGGPQTQSWGDELLYLLPLGVKDVFSFVPGSAANVRLEFIFLQQEESATSLTAPRSQRQGHLLFLLLFSESLEVNGLNS